MTPKLPTTTAKDWFALPSGRGSYFATNEAAMQFTCVRGTKRVVIPMRKGELKRKALRAIIQDLKISVEEFGKLP